MTVFTEGSLQITINDAVTARKFDAAGHGLSHCMKAVDLIIELEDRYLFIEFKDPQHPDASDLSTGEYLESFKNAQLDEDFKYKYRDSFLYEWASGRVEKPVDYLLLIALDTLTSPLLRHRRREMERKLPLRGPDGGPWARPIVRGCGVFNIDSWNRNFPAYPVSRLP